MNRTLDEVTQEYSQTFAELGVACYDIEVTFPAKISKLKERISVLLVEAELLKNKSKTP